MERVIGREIAGYLIEGELGRGGAGIVYRARQLSLDRPVALKLIRADLAGDPSYRERFHVESRLAASIDDPNLVPIYEAGEAEEALFLSMRLVEGHSLQDELRSGGALLPDVAASVVAQAARGLDAIHDAGLVHRDVKPANVLLAGESDELDVFVSDFGLARATALSDGATPTEQFTGTLDYVSPEQLQGQQIDARADVYALGCVLFEALCGGVPFPQEGSSAKVYAHLYGKVPSVTERGGHGLSPFEPVIARALSKRPEDRFRSTGDLGRAVTAASAGEAPTVPEQILAVGAATPEAKGTAPLDIIGASRSPWMKRTALIGVLGLLAALAIAAVALDPFAKNDRSPPAAAAASDAAAVSPAEADPGVPKKATSTGAQRSETARPRPEGPLTTTGLGPVRIGTPARRIARLFGLPDNQKAPGDATLLSWIYRYPDGKLYLYLDARTNRFNDYSSTTSALATPSGFTVGGSFTPIEAEYGDQLRERPTGRRGAQVLSEGRPGTYPAFVFGVDNDGMIRSIGGGAPPLVGD